MPINATSSVTRGFENPDLNETEPRFANQRLLEAKGDRNSVCRKAPVERFALAMMQLVGSDYSSDQATNASLAGSR